MVNIELLLDLYRHMEWADATVWTAVLAADDGPSDAKISGYFYHLHMVQFDPGLISRITANVSCISAHPSRARARAILFETKPL